MSELQKGYNIMKRVRVWVEEGAAKPREEDKANYIMVVITK